MGCAAFFDSKAERDGKGMRGGGGGDLDETGFYFYCALLLAPNYFVYARRFD